MSEHRWDYCHLCDTRMVICGECGNNCCNGGYGEVIAPEKVDGEIVMIECNRCESAYELQNSGEIFSACKFLRDKL